MLYWQHYPLEKSRTENILLQNMEELPVKHWRLTVFLSLILVAALLAGCASETGGTSQDTGETQAGAEAGENTGSLSFEGVDIEGNTVTEEVFTQSKLTMVNVWATYCNPCLSEMPGLGELAAQYDPEEFQIIGIVSDVMDGGEQETLDAAAALIQETGADYTHLLLNESLYYALLTEVSAVPTTFFVDENGTILNTVVGAKEKADWEALIDGYLAEL